MLLNEFSDCRATTLSDAAERIHANASGSLFELERPGDRFTLAANVAQLGDITFVSSGCDAPCRMTWAAADYVRQIFQIDGVSRFSYGERQLESVSSGPGCLIPAGTVLKSENQATFETLSMRIRTQALKRTLETLIGDDAECPSFDYSAPLSEPDMRSLKTATLTLAREVDQIGHRLSNPVLAALAQSVIVKFLIYHKHNYTSRLFRLQALPSRKQLQLIENYLIEHWNEPLDIEALTKTFNIGARTIFRLFARERGYSPAHFLKSIRLDRARAALLACQPGASVLSIALQCGYYSFGHFAREYQKTFGELPSKTLSNSK